MKKITTVYTTYIGNEVQYKGPSLEDAIGTWDALTYKDDPSSPSYGSVSVREWDAEGNCVRDGNLLHVRPGVVYLHPRILNERDKIGGER